MAVATSTERGGSARTAAPALGPAVRSLVEAGIDYTSAALSQKVERWSDRRPQSPAPDLGPAGRAAVEGVKASLTGRNPLWNAAKGAWLGADVKLRTLVVVAVILLLLIAPVVLLLLLLALLVAGVVAAVRAAGR